MGAVKHKRHLWWKKTKRQHHGQKGISLRKNENIILFYLISNFFI